MLSFYLSNSMEAILQKKFDGLEAALNKLLDSITTYNPSITAAHELLAAEADLNEGLGQLAQHQANHRRILALRQTADQLDNQIKNTIRTLAETRKELLNTPFTTFDDTSRDIPVEDILSYAKKIAPFTVPPTYLPSAATTDEAQKRDSGSAHLANGTAGSPAPGTDPNTGTQTPADTQQQPTESQDAGYASMMGDLKTILDREKHAPFLPWPDENRMKASGLMAVQQLFQRDEGAKAPQVEGEVQRTEEEEERRRKEAEGGERRAEPVGESYASSAPQTRKQEQFRGFALYDDDEDDE